MQPHLSRPVDPPPPREWRRSWWWLPEQERRARRERRRAYSRWKAQRSKNDCDFCDCLGDGCGDPCLIALIPVVLTSAVRFAVGGRRAGADPAAPVPAGRTAAALYGAVHHYRARISPTRRACCPYTPSCSTYAVQALHRHGAVRGARLTAGRLLRCRPGTRGGTDPVPER
ncbi:membrane protein insertion efficiency factor YidD [Kitasatospora sp. NBC_00070]|uniref:membrane protein insertion efficiency factor YidD n=1 Tax=Kitasatospora sp. NBC_00070 TaxID=2975962 RepID=UPI00324AD509